MKPFWEDRVRYDDRGQATTTTAAATKLAATAVAVATTAIAISMGCIKM